MNVVLVATAVTVVAGAIIAVSSRDARVALAGLAVALLGAPLLSDPAPEPLPLAARLIAAVLAVELLSIAVRATTAATRGSLVGWTAEGLAAAAALVVGVAVAPAATAGGVDVPAPIVLGAALALGVVAVTPLALGRDALRLGIGATLLVSGATVLQPALLGTPSPFEQLVVAAVVVGLGAAAAAVVANAYEARNDLSLGRASAGAATSVEPAARPRSRGDLT